MMLAKEECDCLFTPMTDSLKWFDKNNAAVITGSRTLKGRTATSSFRSNMWESEGESKAMKFSFRVEIDGLTRQGYWARAQNAYPNSEVQILK